MGLFDRFFGWKEYYDRKFDEFLNTIKEGFKLRDDRISRLEFEVRKPIVQPIVQEVNVKKQQLLELMEDAEVREHILQITKDIVTEEVTVSEDVPVTVSNDNNDTPVTVNNDSNRFNSINKVLEYLPKSRIALINFLLQAENPMSYRQIAQKTSLAYNTIKVYVKDIKDAGYPLEEHKRRNVVLISVPNKIKASVLYGD